MKNTLTAEKLSELAAPFKPEEHSFLPNTTTVFIQKRAIRQRLNAVDPGWSISPAQLVRADEDVIVLSAGLTVCGVTRHALGTGTIQIEKKNPNTHKFEPLPVSEITRNKSKAYKSADTDLIPRCAFQFGVGEYLKNIPKKDGKPVVHDMTSLERWLTTLVEPVEPPHWALNGGGERFKALAAKLGVKWDMIRTQLEPDKVLEKLSDITLPEVDAIARLVELRPAAKTIETAPQPEGTTGDSGSFLARTSNPIRDPFMPRT